MLLVLFVILICMFFDDAGRNAHSKQNFEIEIEIKHTDMKREWPFR